MKEVQDYFPEELYDPVEQGMMRHWKHTNRFMSRKLLAARGGWSAPGAGRKASRGAGMSAGPGRPSGLCRQGLARVKAGNPLEVKAGLAFAQEWGRRSTGLTQVRGKGDISCHVSVARAAVPWSRDAPHLLEGPVCTVPWRIAGICRADLLPHQARSPRLCVPSSVSLS